MWSPRHVEKGETENPVQDQRGSNPGRVHDWRGSQALYQSATSFSPKDSILPFRSQSKNYFNYI